MTTGVILSGGRSSRMGTNKAFLRVGGERLIDRTVGVYRQVFAEIILVTNEPLLYLDMEDITIVTDVVPGRGPLMGIYTGLLFASSDAVFVAPCDMPFLETAFVRYLIQCRGDADIVVPETADGLQPLHAVYSRRCLTPIRGLLARDRLKITDFYRGMKKKVIGEEIIRRFGPPERLFMNVNTVQDMEDLTT